MGGAKVLGFINFMHFILKCTKIQNYVVSLFPFSSFQTSILLKKQIPVQMSYLYLFRPPESQH